MQNLPRSSLRCDPTAIGFGFDRAALRLPRLKLDEHDDAYLPAHIRTVVAGDFWEDGDTNLIVFMTVGTSSLTSILRWTDSGYILAGSFQPSAASFTVDSASVARLRSDLVGVIGVGRKFDGFKLISIDSDGDFQHAFNPTGASFGKVLCADLRGSGLSDIIALTNDRTSLGVFYNKGDGSFYPPVVLRSPVEIQTFTVADLRNTGVFDLVLAGITPQHSHHVFVCEALGNGLYSDARHVFGGPGAAANIYRIIAGDVSGYGGTEVLVADTSRTSLTKLGQYASGSFQQVQTLPEFPPAGEDGFGAMDAVLLSGEDSQPDIAVVGTGGQGRVMRADGHGGYHGIESFELGNKFGFSGMLAAPINGRTALLICDENDVLHTFY